MEENKEFVTEEIVNTNDKSHMSSGSEYTLRTIANIMFALGILVTVFCMFTIVFIEKPEYEGFHYTGDTREFSWQGAVITAVIFFSSLANWAMIRVFTNISLTLKDICNKIK